MDEIVFVQVIKGEAPKWYQEYQGCIFMVKSAPFELGIWGQRDGVMCYAVKEEDFNGSHIEAIDCKVVDITPEQYREALFIREIGEVSRKHGKFIEGYYGYSLLVGQIGALPEEQPRQDDIPHYHWKDEINQYVAEDSLEDEEDA